MPQLSTYLTFDGNCAEAMRFYERTLGGQLEAMMRVGESPMAEQCAPGSADRIMHAKLNLDGRELMGADAMGGQPYEGMKGFAVSLNYPTADEGRKVFEALEVGGQTTMPFQKTFFAEGFGMLVDRFGTPWMVVAHVIEG